MPIKSYLGKIFGGLPRAPPPPLVSEGLNKQTIEKREIIQAAGYKHVSIYECQLKNNEDFKDSQKDSLRK